MAMTTEEVVEWLGTIKLSEYADLFREEELNGKLLASYDLDDLKDMGVENGRHRKKIFVLFRNIK